MSNVSAPGLLELPDLKHTLVDIGTTLLCVSGYNGLPGRTLPLNLIHETARRSEILDNAALSSAASCVKYQAKCWKGPFLQVPKIASKILSQVIKGIGGVL